MLMRRCRWTRKTWTIVFILTAINFILGTYYVNWFRDGGKVVVFVQTRTRRQDFSNNQHQYNNEGGRLPGKKIVLIVARDISQTYATWEAETAQICSTKCFFTEDKSYLNESQAVVVHQYSMSPAEIAQVANDYPPKIWIWYNAEAPKTQSNLPRVLDPFGGVFNWTMTFRKDADILLPYGRFIRIGETNNFGNNVLGDRDRERREDLWATMIARIESESGIWAKSLMPVPTVEQLEDRRMAAWIVSSCNTNAKRHKIVEELQTYIQIDVFGRCGDMRCPSRLGGLNSLANGPDCRQTISGNYKFYLAFENSLCEDYVTEKFFRTFFTQMVPVVYGGANYSAIAPPNSYISATDFDSVRSLANYLIFLDTNPEEMLKYFEWRKRYWVQNMRFVPEFCAICDKLWERKVGKNFELLSKSYLDLTGWWTRRSDFWESGKSACVAPTELKIVKNTWNTWWFWAVDGIESYFNFRC